MKADHLHLTKNLTFDLKSQNRLQSSLPTESFDHLVELAVFSFLCIQMYTSRENEKSGAAYRVIKAQAEVEYVASTIGIP